jgi:hypothetical protein
MDSGMRKGSLKMLIIVGLPVVASLFFYHRLAIFFPKDVLLTRKMDYLYSKGDPDILFLGSSRTMNHVDPRVIDSVCGTRSYNLGLNAFNIAEMRMQLKVCLANGKVPRVLAVNLDPSSFSTKTPVYCFPEILRYAERDTVLRNSMAEIQDVYAWRWKYPFYRFQIFTAFNDGFKVDAIFSGKEYRRARAVFAVGEAVREDYKGFVPIDDPYSETYVSPFNERFDEKGFELLRDLIHLCRERNIQPVFFTGPMYKDYRKTFLNASEILSRVTGILKEERAPYFNMIDDSLSYSKADFFNFVHLNGRAAERFSLKLAVLLRDSIATLRRDPSK